VNNLGSQCLLKSLFMKATHHNLIMRFTCGSCLSALRITVTANIIVNGQHFPACRLYFGVHVCVT